MGKFYSHLELIKLQEDQDILMAIVLTANNHQESLNAFRRLSEMDKITKVAFESDDEEIVLEAIKKIEEKETLTKIALFGKTAKVRLAALMKLKSVEVCIRVLESKEPSEKVKHFAIDFLVENNKCEPKLMLKLALEDDSELIREMATKQIYLQDDLVKVIQKSKDKSIRILAAAKLHDDYKILELLEKLVFDEELFKALIKNVHNEDNITRFVKRVNIPFVCEWLVYSVKQQKNLEIISTQAKNAYARCVASLILKNKI